jgi:hypothetical protein
VSDPFWDELGRALPRHRRGEPGWAQRRRAILAAVRGDASPRPRMAAGLAAGALMAALTFAVLRRPATAPVPAPGAPEELQMLEDESMLEHLDILLEAAELDAA